MKDYIQKILRVFTESEHSQDVTKEVHQWLLNDEHAQEKDAELRMIWDQTEGKADASTWRSLSQIYHRLGVGERKGINRLQMKIWKYAVAAVVALTVSISGTFILTKSIYSGIAMVESFTPAGDMNIITLPDGSQVHTNSETLLLYPEKFKGDTRTVYLMGEASFNVKKDTNKPFIVKAKTMAITALGTEFNVMAYPAQDEIVATLIRGKIKVDCDNAEKSYILNPGQQVTYLNSSLTSTLSNVNVEDVTAWQQGISVFRGVTMKEILSSLERTYGVSFQYNESLFNDDKYNFRFIQNSQINEIMMIIQEVVGGFSYKLQDDICYIKSVR